MKWPMNIMVNDGAGLCEKFPIIGVFNFERNNLYRAHATDIETAELIDSCVAIFKIKPKNTAV